MTSDLISLAQCAEFSGLGEDEMLLGVSPLAMHHSLYAGYLLHVRRGVEAVREAIVSDIRSSLELGASKQAADLFIVLRWFLSDYPEARLCPPGCEIGGIHRFLRVRRQPQCRARVYTLAHESQFRRPKTTDSSCLREADASPDLWTRR